MTSQFLFVEEYALNYMPRLVVFMILGLVNNFIVKFWPRVDGFGNDIWSRLTFKKKRSCWGLTEGSTPTILCWEVKKSNIELVVELGRRVSLFDITKV